MIRSALKEDAGQIYTLLCELEGAPLNRKAFEAVFEANLNDPLVLLFVAEQGGAATGFLSLHLQQLLHHCALIGEIQELIVKKEERGKGMGRALFEKAEEAARKSGCAQLEVCCGRSRTGSHTFYLSRGMENTHFKFCRKL